MKEVLKKCWRKSKKIYQILEVWRNLERKFEDIWKKNEGDGKEKLD